jgi:hypothetical protein
MMPACIKGVLPAALQEGEQPFDSRNNPAEKKSKNILRFRAFGVILIADRLLSLKEVQHERTT